MPRSAIQGMDVVLREVARDFRALLRLYLPGWVGDGVRNFQAGATTPRATAQLQILMHNELR